MEPVREPRDFTLQARLENGTGWIVIAVILGCRNCPQLPALENGSYHEPTASTVCQIARVIAASVETFRICQANRKVARRVLPFFRSAKLDFSRGRDNG
jgi:hypothetical protein